MRSFRILAQVMRQPHAAFSAAAITTPQHLGLHSTTRLSSSSSSGNGGDSPSIDVMDAEAQTGESAAVELKQGSRTEAATPATQGFYDNVVYEAAGTLPKVQPRGMDIELLPFQQEGVAWMMHREDFYTGGVMADHLGMGKTVQMIGLCIANAPPSRLQQFEEFKASGKSVAASLKKKKGGNTQNKVELKGKKGAVVVTPRQKIKMHLNTKPLGYRIITIIQQMLKISAVGNCSRITRPGKDLYGIMKEVEGLVLKFNSKYDTILKEMNPWLDFCQRYHPAFTRRARAFLADEKAVSFSEADTPELRTLVILPASLILQWKSEIEKKVEAGMNITVHVFHGPKARDITMAELESMDFVLTSYETVAIGSTKHFHQSMGEGAAAVRNRNHMHQGERYHHSHAYFDRENAGPLFQIKWKRIILDEAHMIRHSVTRRWRAVNELQSIKRWVVSATPLHNSIEDLQNLLSFINTPKLPVVQAQSPEQMLKDPVLQRSISRALQPVFLRRGPVMIRNGQKEVLVKLPPKEERLLTCELSEDETILYNDILLRSKHQIGSMAGEKKTLHLFAMMTRLRQTCCHPWLGRGKSVQIYQCGICKSEASNAIVTKCGHSFCHDCLLQKFDEAVLSGEQEEDPNIPLTAANTGPGSDMDHRQKVRIPCPTCDFALPFSVFKKHHLCSKAHIDLLKKKEWVSSSKMNQILDNVRNVLSNFPGEKVVIFSHFTSFLDIISVAMDREETPFLRLDGTMTLRERNTVIEHFGGDHSVRVLLASKMAIGVGLNLTMANHVIVVDPWWNPAIEEQAVHRCHRIGQKRPVTITRYIVSSTIEQYCYEVCQRKKEFGDAVLKAATNQESEKNTKTISKLDEVVNKLHAIERKGDSSNNKGGGGASNRRQHTIAEARAVLL